MGERVTEVRVGAVQEWEQTDLLGLWAAPANAAAEGERQGSVAVAAAAVTAAEVKAPEDALPEGGAGDSNGVDPVALASAGATAAGAGSAGAGSVGLISVSVLSDAEALDAEAMNANGAAGEKGASANVAPEPAAAAMGAPREQVVTTRVAAPVATTSDPLASSSPAPADRPSGQVAPPLSLPEFTAPPARGTLFVPERLLILDTETTALHPDEGACIEVGAVLFHVATRSVLTQVSFLLPCEVNGAETVNGIPAAVSQLAQPWREALNCFLAMVASAEAILAHNAAFDRQWFGRGPLPPLDKPWICSMEDIGWPRNLHLRATPSVRDLAIAHGVPVWAAHRALTDCTYLVQVLERCDDLEQLLRQAGEPRQLYRAQLGYSERQMAKDAGFRWNEPVQGAWTRRLSEREAAALPFPVRPVVSA
ncbi:MAG: 3'-5' exonuclease [Cyanobacteriota bacterium]